MRKFIPLSILALILGAASLQAQTFTCDPDVDAPGDMTQGYSSIITYEVSPGRLDSATGLWVDAARYSVLRCACATEPEVNACVKAAFRDGVLQRITGRRRFHYWYPVVGALSSSVTEQTPPPINGYPWPDKPTP